MHYALGKCQQWHIFLLFFTRRKFRSNLQQKWSTKKFKYKVFKCTTSTTTCTPTYLRQVWMVSCNMRRSRSLFASISQKHFLVQVIFTFSSFRASLGRFVESVTVHFFFRNDDWLWWSIQRENFFFCVWGQILHFERSVIESRYSCQRNFCAHNLYLRCFGWRFWAYDVWIHKNLVAARVKAVCTLKKTCFDIPM